MSDIPALEALIADAGADPAAAETALLSSVLYVVPHEGAAVQAGTPLNLSGIVLKDGQQATAAFTRPELATAVFGAPASHGMRGVHLLEGFVGGWIVINPGQDKGLILDPDTAAGILARAGSAQPLAEQDDIEITIPDRVPTALVETLKTVLKAAPVTGAWLGRSHDPKTGQTGWRIEVRGAISPDQARALVSQALAPFDLGGEPIDLVTACGDGADAPGLKLI